MPDLQDLVNQYPDALEPIRQFLQSQFNHRLNPGPPTPFSLAEASHPTNRPAGPPAWARGAGPPQGVVGAPSAQPTVGKEPDLIPLREDLDKFRRTSGEFDTAAVEPFEEAAASEERIRKLKGLKDMIESLRGFKAVTAGDVMFGSDGPAPPFQAETIREEIGKEEDRVPMQMRNALEERWGIALPDNARFSQVRQLMPAFSSVFRDQLSQERLSNESRRMDQADERLTQGGTRLEMQREGEDRRQWSARKLSEKTTLSFSDAARLISKVETTLEKVRAGDRGAMSGPILNRVNNLLGYVGLEDSKSREFQADIVDDLANYLRSISGLVVTEHERKLLTKVIGDPNMKSATLDLLLQRFLDNLKASYESKRKGLSGQGYSVDGTDLEGLKGAGGKIKVFNEKTGEYGEIPASQRAELEALPHIKIVE